MLVHTRPRVVHALVKPGGEVVLDRLPLQRRRVERELLTAVGASVFLLRRSDDSAGREGGEAADVGKGVVMKAA